ncbi:BZ3500_MvSof-1268-A1-R1_Chr4-4g07521 [Microbotryum saponariae]|uniref:BZ3500_MvSof-1268-A1-R1_Chr4-4g07521 protein n=1 Tax=Microbotryum saponariae TaxID=289078 RepID=A0A2X0MWM1_9BASI|nr:BZ3500_MvSof-1268-A1-R1_Chr4-4g07521 [Microbotryum saponariae]SDA07182.1 BZ3501_MvSof-1269-A2-R1_Chr4-3g07229 [Microbotryum saponariae]
MPATITTSLRGWLKREPSLVEQLSPESNDVQPVRIALNHSSSYDDDDEVKPVTPLSSPPHLEKNPGQVKSESEGVHHIQENNAFLDEADLDPEFLDENGKERPIETPQDFATRLMSLEDETSLKVHTVRMWTIGIILTVCEYSDVQTRSCDRRSTCSCRLHVLPKVGGVLGEVFKFRPQGLDVSALFLFGVAWYKLLPKAERGKFWAVLNPGPFNIKEHVCITVMAGAGAIGALALPAFAAERMYYDIVPNKAMAILTLLSSQFFGYGLAGLFRSVVVYPTYAVWPELIPTVALVDTLNRDQNLAVQKHRYKVFWIVLAIAFAWEWFPQVIAPTLTGFSVFCLANRTNSNFTRLFGGTTGAEGLGLFSVSLDWLSITSGQSSYGNVWNVRKLPLMGQTLFHEDGRLYNQSLILDSHSRLNQTALAIQGLPSFTWTRAVMSIGVNLSISASIMHVILRWRGKVQNDAHYIKMQAYPECPTWWYSVTAVLSFALALISLYLAKTGMPWYALVVGCLFALIYTPVMCLLASITGFGISGGALTQMLGAALVPHNARANLYFRLYSSNSVIQGATMIRSLKFGQYTKVPPRAMFTAQFVGTFVGSFISYAIMNWIVDTHSDVLLTVEGTIQWTGMGVQSFNAQVSRLTEPNLALHHSDRSFPFYCCVPVPFYVGHRLFPKLHLNRIVTPALCAAIGVLSAGITSRLMSYFFVALFS